ncbi:MAG: hypothetical protein M3R71_04370 [Actinomycetota bacterium]|nr:hypothetical protein [Actinomycetota bacterium]
MAATLPSVSMEDGHGGDDGKRGAPRDDFERAVERWGAESRVTDAAAARGRQRWLHQQASEAATLLGLLVDLAERQSHVVLTTRSAFRHAGLLVGVGSNFCVVTDQAIGTTLVASDAITSVVVAGSAGVAPATPAAAGDRDHFGIAAGDRQSFRGTTLADSLAALAAERSSVRFRLAGGDQVVGALTSVGVDVSSVRLEGRERRMTHVSLAAVESCTAR